MKASKRLDSFRLKPLVTNAYGDEERVKSTSDASVWHCSLIRYFTSDLGSEAFGGPVQRESGAPLAGNYGGIGSRSSRGHSASLPECSTSSLSDRSLESIDNRLSRLEQELMETREEIKKLRSCVEVLQPPSS